MPESNAVSPYITPAGYAHLKSQLKDLWLVQRPIMTERLSKAAALGDRSENADYIYCKRQIIAIDEKVRKINSRLDAINVVYDKPKKTDTIYFGAVVDLGTRDSTQRRYRIVGADETDLHTNGISIDSPLARALIGKQVEAEITLKSPGDGSTLFYRVIGINYPD